MRKLSKTSSNLSQDLDYITHAVNNDETPSLVKYDTLKKEAFDPTLYGNATFYNFKEGRFDLFIPTYRIISEDQYLLSDMTNPPSWSDRIIYRSKSKKMGAFETL